MSNFNNQNQQQTWEPDIFNDDKLYLKGKPIQDGGWNTRMRLKTKENNPCLEVSTGLKDKKDRQIRHEIPMSPRVLEELLYMIEAVATYKQAISFELENWNYVWRWNQQTQKSERSENVEVIGKISVYKNEVGIIGIDFSFRGGKTVVPFVFESDDYHKWMSNGNYMDEAQTSKIAALSWIKTIRSVYNQMYVKEWKEPEWQKRARIERIQKATGQGGGGGNWGGGGNRQQNQSRPQHQQGYNNQPPAGANTESFEDSFGSSMDFSGDTGGDVPF